MNKFFVILILFFITSCTHNTNNNYFLIESNKQETLKMFQEYWNSNKNLPKLNKDCYKQFDFVTPSYKVFSEKCGSTPYMSYGCIVENYHIGNFIKKEKLIILSYSGNEKEIIVNMSLHALSSCALPTNKNDKYDYARFRKFVWYQNSKEDSLQYKLMTLTYEY